MSKESKIISIDLTQKKEKGIMNLKKQRRELPMGMQLMSFPPTDENVEINR